MITKTVLAIIILLLSLPAIVYSDVMFKSKTSMEMLGFGSTETTFTTYIKGEAGWSETSTSFKSELLQMGDAGMVSEKIEITRLDKGLLWILNQKNKTYIEISLNALRGVLGEMVEDNPYAAEESSEDDNDNYIWTFDISFSDNTEEVNGFLCNKATISSLGVNKDDNTDSSIITTKIWKSEEIPEFDEANNFYAKYSELIDSEAGPLAFFTEEFLFAFGNEFSNSSNEIKRMKGYTVKTEMLTQKSGVKSSGPDDEESQVSSMLKGLLGKKAKTDKSKEPAKGRVTVLLVTAEITEVETSTIEDSLFEIPEGYVKTQ